ncbi:serine hydrolase domain-containing protein [Pedobacter sp.]|uniref:serine hydrolase domain-containing protein n=1 Tax=Pedobacter sp. TaxID=1411316 RepID=UPI003D7FCE6B
MKKYILFLALMVLIQPVIAQDYLKLLKNYPTAEESNPIKMGWMQGFPPPKDKIISAADGSFFKFPASRYSVNHMRQFLPTTVVLAAQTNRYNFTVDLDKAIDNITFTVMGTNEKITWRESLDKVYADGVIVLHKGKIVYENYFGGLAPDGTHALMSVSKTFTGTLGALLIAEGVLDENKTAGDYVPELKKSAFGDATLRQILDMTTALQYDEDYNNPKSDIWAYSAAGNPFPKPAGYKGPENYYEYLETVKKAGTHGKVFAYKTINTDAMGWVISRVTGKSIPELISERFWKPLGTHHDGYYQVDGSGIAFAGGGFNVNLRDLAMFGEMVSNKGFFNGKQILPAKVVEQFRAGGNREAFAKAGYTNLKNWSYTDMWWVTDNKDGAITARGVYGQTIYVDPVAKMVIVRFASNPFAPNQANDPYSLPAYKALTSYFLRKK